MEKLHHNSQRYYQKGTDKLIEKSIKRDCRKYDKPINIPDIGVDILTNKSAIVPYICRVSYFDFEEES